MAKSVTKPSLPSTYQARSASSSVLENKVRSKRSRRSSKRKDSSDVLISAVISSYLLTHLHHLLQRAENHAAQEGRVLQAENYAQLRKVLCMDARSMEDACAIGLRDGDFEKFNHSKIAQKVA